MNNRPTTALIIGILSLLSLVLVIVDCSSGRIVHDEATVTGRYYKPPWTETTVHWDEDGGFSIDTTDHPEEWHTTLTVNETGHARDFNAGKHLYLTLTNGQFVTIQSRRGRWTGIKYMGRIEP